VGLPLAAAFAETGTEVLGVDVSAEKVASVNAGRSYVEDVESNELAKHLQNGCLRASTDPAGLRKCDAILICLPTPLDEHRNPDLSYVIAGAEMAAANLAPDALVVLESTTYPGTTREVVKPILERDGRQVGTDLFLAFSPERVDPGNGTYGVRNTPKVVGGLTDACTKRAAALYGLICEKVHVVSSPESAEMSKILENTFRAVNIALVNEMAVLSERMGIDLWESIDAASTKPFGFMPFWPGPGLGGHCIPIDPFYLTWRAKAYDLSTEFVELAGRINTNMPYYAVSRVTRALNKGGVASSNAKVLLLGVAYKPNVGDMRESPSLKLLSLLRGEGIDVRYHDPHVPELRNEGLQSVALTDEQLAWADAVVIATDHRAVDYGPVVSKSKRIVDLRNAVRRSLGAGPAGPIPDNVDVL
jgi:UDP-N-acetyl-D-glucosamine dehydrogenase